MHAIGHFRIFRKSQTFVGVGIGNFDELKKIKKVRKL